MERQFHNPNSEFDAPFEVEAEVVPVDNGRWFTTLPIFTLTPGTGIFHDLSDRNSASSNTSRALLDASSTWRFRAHPIEIWNASSAESCPGLWYRTGWSNDSTVSLHTFNKRISSGFDKAVALSMTEELATWRTRNVRFESGDLNHINLLGLTANWCTLLVWMADEIWSRKWSLLEVVNEIGLDKLMWSGNGAPRSLVMKLCSLIWLPMSSLTLLINWTNFCCCLANGCPE